MSRIPLGFFPTPLHELKNLSAHMGGPRIWIKRDDCTGLALGGNKVRKLEYILADALQKNADVLITVGAVTSNHARQTAAAAAVLGLECHLVLIGRPPESKQGITCWMTCWEPKRSVFPTAW
ncbi:MAG TPA: pyridoxal-phosphate dependent enzyme [Syntrophomonadaceae bacterium]|nr:pyridoxal-phosphate dependent enzyme [Syntrophomonadaceae bacterium]